MRELLNKLLKLKPAAKFGVTIGVIGLIAGLYYQLIYADLSDQIAGATQRQSQLKTELEGYQKRQVEYLAYRNELDHLQKEQRDLLKVLPERAEIGAFLSNVQEQLELAGLEISNYTVENEIPQELYVKIPIRFEVRGGFHNITKFFKSVAGLKRIVNIENVAISTDQARQPNEQSATVQANKLKARFVAVTFRYADKVEEGGGT